MASTAPARLPSTLMEPTGDMSPTDQGEAVFNSRDEDKEYSSNSRQSVLKLDGDMGFHKLGWDDDVGLYEGRFPIFVWEIQDSAWNPVHRKYAPGMLGSFFPGKLGGIGWVSQTDYNRYMEVLVELQERILEARITLAEVAGLRPSLLPSGNGYTFDFYKPERHGVPVKVPMGDPNHWALQSSLSLIASGQILADPITGWTGIMSRRVPSQGILHTSFYVYWNDSHRDDSMHYMLDASPDRPWKDLLEVMRIALPRFREMKARVEALSKLNNIGYSSSSSHPASMFGPTNMANIITCLDVVESVAKMIPVLGDVLEGACGTLRKIIQAGETARAARDECKALAEHTASITLAIVNEIGSTSTRNGFEVKRICDLSGTIGQVNHEIQKLSKLSRFRYFVSRGRINAEVLDLRTRIDNARIAFQIRNDISTTQLLHDLRIMQARMMSQVDDIYAVQRTMDAKLDATQSKLDMILVQVCMNSDTSFRGVLR